MSQILNTLFFAEFISIYLHFHVTEIRGKYKLLNNFTQNKFPEKLRQDVVGNT